MLIHVGGRFYGWGATTKALTDYKESYGRKMLSDDEAKRLVVAMKEHGWLPVWKRAVQHRVVFLCDVGAGWKQEVTARGYEHCTLQAIEDPAYTGPREDAEAPKEAP